MPKALLHRASDRPATISVVSGAGIFLTRNPLASRGQLQLHNFGSFKKSYIHPAPEIWLRFHAFEPIKCNKHLDIIKRNKKE